MNGKQYELRILPLFEEHLQETADYIAFHLQNPVAALSFVNAVETAILERLKAPESFEPYHSKKDREHTYYAIPVKNYLIFYVVIGNVMEVRTLIYSRRNLPELI